MFCRPQCNPDGTDIVVAQECQLAQNGDGTWGSGAVTCGAVHGIAKIDGDDGYTLYVNEQEVGTAEDYTRVQAYTFEADCDTPTVYAIDAYDTGGIASVIASVDHCGEKIITSAAWKCHQFGDAGPPDDWKSLDFDDSLWPEAGDAGDNGVAPVRISLSALE
eukprot:SAG31_NODE_487_length_14980_cov_9.526376_21_plen_162_part_00